MNAPIIGITIQKSTNEHGITRQTLQDSYIQAVSRAGGIPVLIPLGISNRDLDLLMQRLDGLLLSGGGDMDPQRYRSPKHPSLFGLDAERDRQEIQLVRFAAKAGIPFLAICRGIQVLNVALGGSLFIDLDSFYSNSIKHNYDSLTEREFLAHRIDLVPASRLQQILGTSPFWVNSLHHQGVKFIGKGLTANAVAPDQLVEGVELEGHPFGIGVQWHPESLPEAPQTIQLFDAFIQAARKNPA